MPVFPPFPMQHLLTQAFQCVSNKWQEPL